MSPGSSEGETSKDTPGGDTIDRCEITLKRRNKGSFSSQNLSTGMSLVPVVEVLIGWRFYHIFLSCKDDMWADR